MRKALCIITVFAVIMNVLTGCTVLQKLGLQKNDNDEVFPASSIVMSEDEAKKLSDKVPIRLYFANEDNSKLKLEIRYIPASEAKKSVNNLAAVIVNEIIKGPDRDSKLKPTIPAGTQLRSPIDISAGVATVDFTKDFVTKHPGGKAAEQMTIYSIVNSLTELKEIQKVKFLIEGKSQKEYKGNFQFDVPFPRSASLISKEPPSSTSSPTSTRDTQGQGTSRSNTGTTNQQSTVKAPDTKNPSTGGKTSSSTDDASEEAEATYLEILE